MWLLQNLFIRLIHVDSTSFWNQTLFSLNLMNACACVGYAHAQYGMMDYAGRQSTLKAAINYFKISTNALAYFVEIWIYVHSKMFTISPVINKGVYKWMRSIRSLVNVCVFETTWISSLKRCDQIENQLLFSPHYLNRKFMLENIYRLMYSGCMVCVCVCERIGRILKWIAKVYTPFICIMKIHWKCNVHLNPLFRLRKLHSRKCKDDHCVYLNNVPPYLPKRQTFSTKCRW